MILSSGDSVNHWRSVSNMWRIFVLGSNFSFVGSGEPSSVNSFSLSSSLWRFKGRDCPSLAGSERAISSTSSWDGSNNDPEKMRFRSMGARQSGPSRSQWVPAYGRMNATLHCAPSSSLLYKRILVQLSYHDNQQNDSRFSPFACPYDFVQTFWTKFSMIMGLKFLDATLTWAELVPTNCYLPVACKC